MSSWMILATGIAIGGFASWLVGRSQSAEAVSRAASLPAENPPQPSTPANSLPSVSIDSVKVDSVASASEKRLDTDSEIERLREQLQRTQIAHYMAQEIGQFKAGFLARTSHELRSPINSVISLHQLILSDLCENPEEEREFVAQAYTAAQKMLSLLDELNNVSKVTQNLAQLKIQPVCLEDVVMEVQSLTYLAARNRNLRLEIEFPDPDIYVLTDPNWLRQVLVSLVNAPILLMQEGTIQLTTQVDQAAQQVHIQIEDQRPAHFWYEPIDLLQTLKDQIMASDRATALDQINQLKTQVDQLPSPGLSLLMNQMVLDVMGGQLKILSIPAHDIAEAKGDPQITRLQCSVPWIVPDAVDSDSEA